MAEEKNFIDDVMTGEAADKLELQRLELLEAARNKYYDDRTLEDWRVLFFEYQTILGETESKLKTAERLLGVYRRHVARVRTKFREIEGYRVLAIDVVNLARGQAPRKSFGMKIAEMVLDLVRKMASGLPSEGNVIYNDLANDVDAFDIPF